MVGTDKKNTSSLENGIVFRISNCDVEKARKIVDKSTTLTTFYTFSHVVNLYKFSKSIEIDDFRVGNTSRYESENGLLKHRLLVVYYHSYKTLVGIKVSPYTIERDLNKLIESIQKRVLCQDI